MFPISYPASLVLNLNVVARDKTFFGKLHIEMSPHTLCGNKPNEGGVVVGSEVKICN